MAPMTGEEVFRMIVEMQQKAKAQNGKLTDLALPDDMYEELAAWAKKYTKVDITFESEDRVMMVNGSRIHTGEDD